MKISIVIPVHNEAHRLPISVPEIVRYMRKNWDYWEIILVENGSTDDTLRICQQFAHKNLNISTIITGTRGKGLAVSRGMLAAHGDLRYMCDVDLSTPISALSDYVAAINNGADIAIGSRREMNLPLRRMLTGRVFNLFVRALVVPGILDTQCGFKIFTAYAAERIFAHTTISSMAFDVEVLHLARASGFTITEVPVNWVYDGHSQVRLLHDSVDMFVDVLRLAFTAYHNRSTHNRSTASAKSSSEG